MGKMEVGIELQIPEFHMHTHTCAHTSIQGGRGHKHEEIYKITNYPHLCVHVCMLALMQQKTPEAKTTLTSYVCAGTSALICYHAIENSWFKNPVQFLPANLDRPCEWLKNVMYLCNLDKLQQFCPSGNKYINQLIHTSNLYTAAPE